MNSKTLAKLEYIEGERFFQTLEGHTEDALKILGVYIEKHQEVIQQFCGRWRLDIEIFLRNLFVTVYLHDIGKLTKEFQENIMECRHSPRYPHAYYGSYLLQNTFKEAIIEDVLIELAAILGHHTPLYNQIFSEENLIETPTFLLNKIKKHIKSARVMYQRLKFDKYFTLTTNIDFEIPEFSLRKINKWRKKFIYEVNSTIDETENWKEVRSCFTYFFAILQTCDDYASANFSVFANNYGGDRGVFGSVLERPEEYVPTLTVDNPKIVLGDYTPYLFQQDILEVKEIPQFAILFAPCGRGKTEAALFWALRVLKEHRRDKIILAMPTQTTSNIMYERLTSIFGSKNVGLYHGRSFMKLKEEQRKEASDGDEEDIEELKSETFKGNTFLKPIIVTTVDHLLYSFVKGFRQADFAFGNLQNAAIIFDEVHYYEKLTLEHLLATFSMLIEMGIPHFLMSGTLPKFLLEKLHKVYKHFSDNEGLKFKPFKLEFVNRCMWEEETLKEVENFYKQDFTQFIILNTVEKAKKVYLEIKKCLLKKVDEPNIMLYHSQFTYGDRIRKEKEIMQRLSHKPFILVATQVIEISLDISCDIMHTELAPPDAIGQRAGRINRKGKKWKNGKTHLLKIYKSDTYHPYTEELFEKARLIIPKYQIPLNYEKIRDICNKVYVDYKLEIPNPWYNIYQLAKESAVFGYCWKDVTFDGKEGRIFKVRDNKFQYVDVVPLCIYENLDQEALRVKNMAKMPLYILINGMQQENSHFVRIEVKKGTRTHSYWLCGYPYSYEIGFNYEETETSIL